MLHQSELISTDINAYLAQHERKELLRFLTCGNVDYGKSTLIRRLLHDSKMIYEDQLAAIQNDSVKSGTTGAGKIDLALLVDGLQAEREQGITIDVAYRYFSTSTRKFIIADTPGHEQYTRNMATGASTCDLAVILIDARYGVQTQTKRHSYIVSLLGIKHVIVAINKMDLVAYSEATFNHIKDTYLTFAQDLALEDIHFIPMSALDGDNVVNPSTNMPWFTGKPMMALLNTIELTEDHNFIDARLPVQYVNRPNLDFRSFCGTVASGVFHKGDKITVMPSGKTSHIKAIISYEGELESAFTNMAISLTLTDEIDISRGDVIMGRQQHTPEMADTFNATLVWMAKQPMKLGVLYVIKLGTRTVFGAVSFIHRRIDVNTLENHDADDLKLNEIGFCTVALNAPVIFDPYQQNKNMGAFILIDRISNVTFGAGMINEAVENEHWLPVTNELRSARFGQTPAIINLHGGNSKQVAYHLERKLFNNGHVVVVFEQASDELASAFKQAGLLCLTIDRDLTKYDFNFDCTECTVDQIYGSLKNLDVIF
jgi:bifunctional enzyme CysN/CysC